jgi:pilus assembly protein CpaF
MSPLFGKISQPQESQAPSVSSSSAPLIPDAPAHVQIQYPPEWAKMRRWITDKVLVSLAGPAELIRDEKTSQMVSERFTVIYQQSGVNWDPEFEKKMEQQVLAEILGFGPLDPLLDDPSITEIMVNGAEHVFVEQKGHITEISVKFDDEAHLMRIIDRIIRPLGRRVDRKSPMVDARLPDGSRVNVIIPPSAIHGATVTIRKFAQKKLQIEDLIKFESLTPQMGEFLRACVVSRLNIVVAGGTGSGKTTLLNVLSNFIPDEERVVTIEDSAELQLNKPHVVSLEARPAEADGTGRVTIRELVINSLRMRPDRIVVGEVRSGEALDMLQAMNTGHDGSLTTIHANTTRDVISRLETLVLMAGIDFPIKVVREQISSAIDLIVQQTRLRDGARKIVQITEVQGMEGEVVVLQDIFRFIEKGLDANEKVIGDMMPTGIRPRFTPRLEVAGFILPPEIFTSGAQENWGRRR